MDTRQEMKEVIKEMMIGDLRRAITFIKSVDIDQLKKYKIPLNILVALSQVTSKPKLGDKVTTNDILYLIIWCCSKITAPTQLEISTYYRSLYHLMKYLCDKIDLSDLANLSQYIIPEWITSEETTNEIYELIVHLNILMNNDIIIPNLSTKDVDSLINCLKHHLQLQHIIFNRKPMLLFKTMQVRVNLFRKKINYEYFPGFYKFIIRLISNLKSIDNVEVSIEAYNTLSSILTLLTINNVTNLDNKSYVTDIFSQILVLCSATTELQSNVDIFKLFYEIFVRDIKTYEKNDIDKCKKLRENCEVLLKKYGLSNLTLITFNNMTDIIRSLINTFDKIKKEPWLKYMTIEIQLEYIKIFSMISKVIKTDKYIDNCNPNCTMKYNYTYACMISSLSATFMNISLRYDCKNIELLNDTAIILIKDCCKYIGQLKQNSCNRWTSNWRILGALIYNISAKFYKSQNYKLAKFYFKLLLTQTIQFEGVKDANLISESALGNILHFIAHCYNHSQQYRSALTFLTFAILISPELHDTLWLTWMNVKLKANNNDIGNVFELTIKDILEKDIEIFQQYNPNFVIEGNEVEKLLYIELEFYYKLWPSKIPMNNTSKQILHTCNDIYLRTSVLNLSWEKVISLQDEKYIENIENTILLINKKDKGKTLINQLCLSVLYFIDFQFKSYEVLKKNLSEMNAAVKEETPIVKPYEEPNDKCNINPTYYNNKIEKNMQIYKILNKSVDLWTKILQNKTVNEIKDNLIELNIGTLIEKTALEYRIQNYKYQMVKIWFLYLQLGKILEQTDIIFTSIGYILESIDCSSKVAKNLVEISNSYIKNKTVSTESILTYYVNKCTGYLQSNHLNEGVELLNNIQKLLDVEKNCPKILEARMLYLKSLYLQRSCELKLLPHDKNYIILIHNALGMVVEFYKEGGSKCLYTLSLLFDISLSIGKLYKILRMPRETKCYTSEYVLLAQQLVLPIRTAQQFSLLAFIDLLGYHFDDCKVKISGIDYILGYQNNTLYSKNKVTPIDEKIIEVSKQLERINISRNDRIETMLDIPIDHRLKNMQGSPILENNSFTLPNFIYHLDCNCFYCTNLIYLHLVLESVHLQALYYLNQSNIYSSSEFFKGGVRIYRGILKKYDSKVLSPEMSALFKKDLKNIYSEMLLDYSLYFAKQKNFDESLKIIEEITELLGENLVTNSYFFMKLLYNKINYLTAKDDNLSEMEISSNESSIDYSVYITKTPENKISVAKIPILISPSVEPITKRRIRKELKFNLDSDEEKDKPSEVIKKTYKMKTPAKTPAPKSTKVKIFTAPSTRTNKVKPLSMSLSPKNDIIDIPVLPKSPIETNSKLKTKKTLEKNTKLLTEKLKTEQKPVLKETNKIKTLPELKKTNDKSKENVRKTRRNLLDKVEEPVVKNGKEKVNSKIVEEKSQVTIRRRQYKRILPNSSHSTEN